MKYANTDKLHEVIKDFVDTAISMPGSKMHQALVDKVVSGDFLSKYEKWLTRGEKEDDDFKTFRLNKMAFPKQREVLLDARAYKRVYLMCGRRAGKSIFNALYMLATAIDKAPARILYIGLTITKGVELIWDSCHILDLADAIGLEYTAHRSDSYIDFANGSTIHFTGNASTAEREKARGDYWDLIIIDEAQSQGESIDYFIQSILEPMLMDRQGQLILTGTGPRTRGLYWARVWENEKDCFPGYRQNWNLTDNPFILDHDTVLTEERKKHGWSEGDNTYIREYLGKISYDDDALVYRLKPENYYTDEEFTIWLNKQPITDIRFTAGMDYGFRDADAFVIVCYSKSSRERWLITEYKKFRSGWEELGNKVIELLAAQALNPMFDRTLTILPGDPAYPSRFDIHIDGSADPVIKRINRPTTNLPIYAEPATGGKKTAIDFRRRFGLNIIDAYKANKDNAVEQLQDDIRCGAFKVRRGSIFDEEATYTVFAREGEDGMGNITREIDDNVYHPDLIDAVLYSMRPVWLNGLPKRKEK
jgi:hypothetical protein